MLKVTWKIWVFPDLKIENHIFFTSLRHALSDLGIYFDILRDKHNLQPNFLPYPIILRFLDLLKSTKL